MATRNRQGAARDTMGRESARLRRDAPGKRFIGERAAQAQAARRAELARVEELAHTAAAVRQAEERAEASIPGILGELVLDSLRLARALLLAPFRILEAARRGRAEGRV